MLLTEVVAKKGTYAAVRFSDETVKKIRQYMKANSIPNRIRSEKLHTTLLYSRKHLPNYEAAGQFDTPLIGIPTKFDIWKSKPDDGSEPTNCLVLEYECDELNARHKKLMADHGATYDFPDYKTHITLSYSVGDLNIADLSPIKEIVDKIEIVSEYSEDLNLNWAKDTGLKEERASHDRRKRLSEDDRRDMKVALGYSRVGLGNV